MRILRISSSEFDKEIELVGLCDEYELVVEESTDISELNMISFGVGEGTLIGKNEFFPFPFPFLLLKHSRGKGGLLNSHNAV